MGTDDRDARFCGLFERALIEMQEITIKVREWRCYIFMRISNRLGEVY